MTQDIKQIKQEVLSFMEENNKTSYFMDDLSKGLNYTSSDDFKELVKAIAELERDRAIILLKDGKFQLLEDEPTFEGQFFGTERGFGFVKIPDFEKDVYIGKDDVNTAIHGDTVKIEVIKESEPWKDRSAEGRVVEVVERATKTVIGEFHAYSDQEVDDLNLYGYITPDDRKLKHFTVQIGTNGLRAVEGQIILVEITQFPRYHNEDMQGIAVKIVGHKDDPGIDILSIAYKHGINPEFPEEVLEEVEDIPDEVLPEEMEGRRDLRGQKIVTIDGADAKDLDDAINVERLDNGNFLLGVHIADVSHYVQEGTALDEEAYSRGTSSYLIDRVIPMLPQKLSNGICSLHPQVDRLTLSCEMEINRQGKTVNYEIYPSVISSYRRMTYTDVNAILEDEDPEIINKNKDLHDMFLAMEELHNILEDKRVRQGALAFDTPEMSFNLEEDGTIESIELVERGVGERMIESFMLAANETVATNYTEDDLPFLYRVHEQPDEAKMQNFIEFASALGVEVRGKKEDISPKVLQGILDKVQGERYERVVNMLMLRSMQQARYDVRPLGHYGLATEYYSHFTAPIRRYPDLVLHRQIHYYDEVGKNQRAHSYWAAQLPDIAEHSSMAERRAVDAEREVEDLKTAEYMVDKVGQRFDGIVTSITNFGMFVQVEDAIEGLVPLSTMKKDYYEFNERGMILIGQRTGETFRIGQELEVELVNVDVESYDIDFELVEGSSKDQKKNINNQQNNQNKKGNNKNKKNNKKSNKQKSRKRKPKAGKKSRNKKFEIRKKK